MRIYSDAFKTMKWDEFTALLSGLNEKTPLGKIVSIRAEDDKDVLKNFTNEMRNIRDSWRKKQGKNMDKKTYDKKMVELERAFALMCK